MTWEIERIPTAMNNTQDLLDYRLKMIENLQKNLEEAGTLCKKLNSENVSLTEEKEKLQNQCSLLLDKQYQDDYSLENSKKIVLNLKKTIERYEKENKSMRELLALWI